jgi:hypothetical protein
MEQLNTLESRVRSLFGEYGDRMWKVRNASAGLRSVFDTTIDSWAEQIGRAKGDPELVRQIQGDIYDRLLDSAGIEEPGVPLK